MSEGDSVSDFAQERVDSLVRFGFSREDIEAFLSEHEGGANERLAWLEERRETASILEDRIAALAQHMPRDGDRFERFKSHMNDPFTIEETYAEFEREIRMVAPWEPSLHRHKETWFGEEEGDVWMMLYQRLAGLDVSSHAAVTPLQRLFNSHLHADELVRHLEVIEADEQRQRQMVQTGVDGMRERGYAMEGIETLPLLDALHELEQWQNFHSRKEHVRLNAIQLIQPFDGPLAAEYEMRCSQLVDVHDQEAVTELSNELHDIARTLEERRREFSERIHHWRMQGIVFPHEGELHPGDLMEWEANHDTISASVERHLELSARWERFARYWPSRVEDSREFIGHLDQTEALQDAVDALDALWKQVELDGLELLQAYEHEGLDVSSWRQQVFDDPLNALERMTLERPRWDRRVALMTALDALDTSFSGDEDVVLRRQLLAGEEIDDDVLDEMDAFVQQVLRRNERHRVMLEEEIAAMRRSGVLEHETVTDGMSIRQLEDHVAQLIKSNGAQASTRTSSKAASRIRAPLERELAALKQAGWGVDAWVSRLDDDPVGVARELSEARHHIVHHDALRRRLGALPWERDVMLALEIELHIKEPHRLEHLNQHVPTYTAHLAGRAVEDGDYELHLWQPQPGHPTLIPVPEQEERPVLQPVSAYDEAHEAILEAMETVAETALPASAVVQPVAAPAAPTVVEVEPVVKEAEEKPMKTEKVRLVPEDEPEDSVEEKRAMELSEEEDDQTPRTEKQAVPVAGTGQAVEALAELLALLGLSDLASTVAEEGVASISDVRRGLAKHVSVAPRDVRVGRLLRLTLRLLPEGNQGDVDRAKTLRQLSELVPPLKRWMRRRLEARHSGATGDFLADAVELGIALERIPGLGRRLPLDEDDWPLPREIEDLTGEVEKLSQTVNLPSAGGVKA